MSSRVLVPALSRTRVARAAAIAVMLFRAISIGQAETSGKPIAETIAEEKVGPVQLHEVSVDQVLEMYERWSGRTILRPQVLPAVTVSLNLEEATKKGDAMRALETVLQLNGVGLAPMGARFLKVTPIAQLKVESPELIEGSTLGLPPSGRVASKMFHLRFMQVGELVPQLAPLLNTTNGAPPVLFDKANAALLTDTISNLQRVETLLADLDHPNLGGLEPHFYSIHYAKASDVVAKIRSTFAGPLASKLGTGTVLNSDDRTNQVIVVTDERQRAFFDALIAKLDLKSEPNTRNEVIPLKSANAKDVATTLTLMVTGQAAAVRAAAGEASRGPVKTGAPAPAANVAPVVAPAPPSLTLEQESSAQFSPFLTILPDERSNALIVSGTVDDIRLIREFVDKIDVLLPQVRIEVVIAEVTLSDSHSSGISQLGLTVSGDKLIGFNVAATGFAVPDGVITRPDGTNVVTGSWDLAGTITLATTPRKSNATILSVPTIITSHNREGSIFVGESRPTISSYITDPGSSATSSGAGYRSTVSNTDIGIQLTVKPLIGSDGSVQMEIKQEVNDVLGDVTIDGNPQPRIGRRTTSSFVSVHSGEIIVLGGLQRNALSSSTSRLGPVPIIGDILGARSKEKTRTDLVFFLRPTILKPGEVTVAPAVLQLEGLPKLQKAELNKLVGATGPKPGR